MKILLIPVIYTIVYFLIASTQPWYYYLAFYMGSLFAQVVIWFIRKYG